MSSTVSLSDVLGLAQRVASDPAAKKVMDQLSKKPAAEAAPSSVVSSIDSGASSSSDLPDHMLPDHMMGGSYMGGSYMGEGGKARWDSLSGDEKAQTLALLEKGREKWQRLSPAEKRARIKAKAKERFDKLSPEEQQEVLRRKASIKAKIARGKELWRQKSPQEQAAIKERLARGRAKLAAMRAARGMYASDEDGDKAVKVDDQGLLLEDDHEASDDDDAMYHGEDDGKYCGDGGKYCGDGKYASDKKRGKHMSTAEGRAWHEKMMRAKAAKHAGKYHTESNSLSD
jgi:DNA-binding MarR family transcriptional regulator